MFSLREILQISTYVHICYINNSEIWATSLRPITKEVNESKGELHTQTQGQEGGISR